MRFNKRGILLFFLCILFMNLLLPLHAYAVNITSDIYSGALPLDEFKKKYDPDNKGDVRVQWTGRSDENGVDHATNFILRARPYEGAPSEEIDRISLDYSPQLVLPIEEISYDVENPLDSSNQSYVKGTVKTWSEVHYEQFETWDEYLQERLDDGWVETTFEGLPAVEKWHDYREYEKRVPLSAKRVIRVLLLDDGHIPGMVVLRIESSYSLDSSWMMGKDAEQFMEPIWEKSKEVWEKDLREIGEKMLTEVFDQTEVTLTRVRLYPGKLGEVPKEVKKEQRERVDVEVNTDADDKSGETDVSIPVALAIVIIGGAAAMVGAGAGTGGDSGDSSGKKKSRYKMCLRKDFGDAIRYDTQPVTVYARIVEVTPEGEEIDRPDLTSAIEIFSGGNLAVEGCSMAGNYMGALVSVQSIPGGENAATGVVSIRFSGEEGSFQNNVTFRIIGKPYISFSEQGSYLTMTLPMLLGDGKVYETPVTLHDFLEKPTSVRLDVAEGVPLSCKLEGIQDIENMEAIEEPGVQSYILKVKNLSTKPEGQQALKQTFGFGILAENDKEKAENRLNAVLYPEGLSIREVKFDDQGYVLIDTFDNDATDEWGDMVPTDFVLDFAVPEQDDEGRPTVRVLEPQEFTPVFGGLKGTGERTAHLAERFKYSIQEIPSNLKEYKFTPEEALVEEEGKPYYLTLPISCTYGQEEYTLDLPVRLLGGGPGPLAGWDEAFAHMKKVVSKVGGISLELAKMLRENGKKMSTAELRLVTYRICHDAVIYYTRDAAEYEKIAAELDNMLYYAEWLKWFGDQAFSYLISKYYGNTADAILSPAKDVFAALFGEVIDYLLNDEQITVEELETIKNITAGVDNLIINAFDDGMSSKNINFKQTCAVVAGFLVWKIAKNIYENRDRDGKVDIYSAITALVADLTAMGVKKIAGNFFDKALENSAVQKALNKPVSKWMQNIAPNVFKGRWDIDKQGEYLLKIVEFKQSDIIKKYLEETFGAGAVKVVEMGAESAQDWLKPTKDSNESPVDLSAWPRISWVSEFIDQNDKKTASLISIDLGFEAIDKFFDHLFGELFGDVPFATEAKSPPVDPPYLPEKSLGTL